MKTLVLVVLLISVLALSAFAYDWVINPANGHQYTLVDSTAWSDAEAQAVALGGHLVTIRSQEENDWIYQWVVNATAADRAWIGLYQIPGSPEPAGGWVWSSGEPVLYTNWNPGEPNNGTNENWAEFWIRTTVYWEYPARWNDTWSVHTAIPIGIVEIIPEPSALLALGGGVSGLLAFRRRRR